MHLLIKNIETGDSKRLNLEDYGHDDNRQAHNLLCNIIDQQKTAHARKLSGPTLSFKDLATRLLFGETVTASLDGQKIQITAACD